MGAAALAGAVATPAGILIGVLALSLLALATWSVKQGKDVSLNFWRLASIEISTPTDSQSENSSEQEEE